MQSLHGAKIHLHVLLIFPYRVNFYATKRYREDPLPGGEVGKERSVTPSYWQFTERMDHPPGAGSTCR